MEVTLPSETEWPISPNMVRTTLTLSSLPPRNRPTGVILLDGSAIYDWCRFEVPFSRLVLENLPMEIDPKTGRYMDDDKRLARQIIRSFTEPISDITIVRRGKWQRVATFTLYVASPKGLDSYERRIKSRLTWEKWVTDNTF